MVYLFWQTSMSPYSGQLDYFVLQPLVGWPMHMQPPICPPCFFLVLYHWLPWAWARLHSQDLFFCAMLFGVLSRKDRYMDKARLTIHCGLSPTRPLYLLLVFLFEKEALHLFSMGLALLDTSSHFLLPLPSTTSPSSNGLCCCISLRSLDNSLLRPTSTSLSWTTKVSCRILSKRRRHFFPLLFLKRDGWISLG